MLAPIILFTYNRYDHTRRTIEALGRNLLAADSDFYIFVDYIDDEQKRAQCRQLYTYLNEKSWKNKFRQVKVIYAAQHQGLAKSVINGVNQIIEEYKKVIVLEDDIVTIPTFLKYMNECLDFYRDDDSVWSISGYAFPCELIYRQPEDLYLGYRANSWGWGTWIDRWNLADWQVKDYNTFKYNVYKRALFNRGGCDLSFMLDRQMRGAIDSWAVRWCYAQYKNDMYTVYPIRTFVTNIGMDGSGTHYVREDGSITPIEDISEKQLEETNQGYILKRLTIDKKISRIVYRYISGNIFQRIKKHFIVLVYHMNVLDYFLKIKKRIRSRTR